MKLNVGSLSIVAGLPNSVFPHPGKSDYRNVAFSPQSKGKEVKPITMSFEMLPPMEASQRIASGAAIDRFDGPSSVPLGMVASP